LQDYDRRRSRLQSIFEVGRSSLRLFALEQGETKIRARKTRHSSLAARPPFKALTGWVLKQ